MSAADPSPDRRLRRAAGGALVLSVLLVLVSVDAARRRSARRRALEPEATLVEATGLADLALSSTSRWLRHPSQAEAGAASADLPLALDADPAGALLGPPRPVVAVGAIRHEVRRR
ncbi:MAG: hypothetical protein ACFCGT_18105 [Sandaracinaceae bacterium]